MDIYMENPKSVSDTLLPFLESCPSDVSSFFLLWAMLVCDPFNGSGTTMIESCLNHRQFIGIELDKQYCELSKKRFLETMKKEKGLFNERKTR